MRRHLHRSTVIALAAGLAATTATAGRAGGLPDRLRHRSRVESDTAEFAFDLGAPPHWHVSTGWWSWSAAMPCPGPVNMR